jgi:hypothetical protein
VSTPKDDKSAIRLIIRAIRAAGWDLDYVDDREEETPVKTEAEALDLIMDLDEVFLVVTRLDPQPGSSVKLKTRGHVFFVLGNDPDEVACDYTVNLEPAIGPLIESWF